MLEPTEPSEIGWPILLGLQNFACKDYWIQNSAVVYRKQWVPKKYALISFSRILRCNKQAAKGVVAQMEERFCKIIELHRSGGDIFTVYSYEQDQILQAKHGH